MIPTQPDFISIEGDIYHFQWHHWSQPANVVLAANSLERTGQTKRSPLSMTTCWKLITYSQLTLKICPIKSHCKNIWKKTYSPKKIPIIICLKILEFQGLSYKLSNTSMQAIYCTVGAVKNETIFFINFSAQDASILKVSVPISKRRS